MLWPLTDWQGTVRDVATYNASTNVTTIGNHKVYEAFGKVYSESAPVVDTIFGYTARYFDDDAGLQWNLNRWYDPGVGRWLSEDPIGFTACDPNLYRYVGNSPGDSVDPSGLAEPPREEGHRKLGSKLKEEKHSAAEHARRLQQRNAARRTAQEARNADVLDALKHIDASIEDCERAEKAAERKMLRDTARQAEHADEVARLAESIERLKEIEIVVDHGEIVDVKHLDDLTEPALEALTRKGRWKIGKKVLGVLPVVGVVAGAASYPQTVQAKGFYCGSLQAGLNEVPFIDWMMVAGGNDVIPSDQYLKEMREVVRHPVKSYDRAREGVEMFSPPPENSWLHDLFDAIDAFLGRF